MLQFSEKVFFFNPVYFCTCLRECVCARVLFLEQIFRTFGLKFVDFLDRLKLKNTGKISSSPLISNYFQNNMKEIAFHHSKM